MLVVFNGRNIPLLEVSNVILGMLGTFSGMIFALGLLTYRTNSGGMIAGIIAGVRSRSTPTFSAICWPRRTNG